MDVAKDIVSAESSGATFNNAAYNIGSRGEIIVYKNLHGADKIYIIKHRNEKDIFQFAVFNLIS